ncbi:hypothetical protein BURC_02898 [Burkholderiaceae bacterium]|nr:hypothetical protein BURC_02898 [Burkholderiaceae bacterium]
MTAPTAVRRRSLLCVLAAACCAVPLASALEAPAGPVVLTVSGEITIRNTPESAAFDMALLQKLPQRSFSTKTPWYPEPRKFTGVMLRDLLAAVGAKGKSVKAIALNDYRVDFPVDEAVAGDAMVAYLLDDKPMAVRDKGPLAIIFPFDSRRDLRTAINYSRAAWQLKALELR